jgi:predicted secreted protein
VQQTFLVDAGDDGGSIQGKQGDLLLIVLPANPSTGFTWAEVNPSTDGSNQAVVTYHKEWFVTEIATGTPVPGQGGILILEFGIGAAGTKELNLELRQSGAPATDPPADTFSISVQSLG